MGTETDFEAPYMSSSGEMNMSLRLMTLVCSAISLAASTTNIRSHDGDVSEASVLCRFSSKGLEC